MSSRLSCLCLPPCRALPPAFAPQASSALRLSSRRRVAAAAHARTSSLRAHWRGWALRHPAAGIAWRPWVARMACHSSVAAVAKDHQTCHLACGEPVPLRIEWLGSCGLCMSGSLQAGILRMSTDPSCLRGFLRRAYSVASSGGSLVRTGFLGILGNRLSSAFGRRSGHASEMGSPRSGAPPLQTVARRSTTC
jgi:hypothetical protein